MGIATHLRDSHRHGRTLLALHRSAGAGLGQDETPIRDRGWSGSTVSWSGSTVSGNSASIAHPASHHPRIAWAAAASPQGLCATNGGLETNGVPETDGVLENELDRRCAPRRAWQRRGLIALAPRAVCAEALCRDGRRSGDSPILIPSARTAGSRAGGTSSTAPPQIGLRVIVGGERGKEAVERLTGERGPGPARTCRPGSRHTADRGEPQRWFRHTAGSRPSRSYHGSQRSQNRIPAGGAHLASATRGHSTGARRRVRRRQCP